MTKQKIAHLNWLKSMGIEYYCSENSSPLKSAKRQVVEPKNIVKKQNIVDKIVSNKVSTPIEQVKNEAAELARKLADSARNLAELREIILNFDGCKLKQLAKNTVFSDGNENAKIMLVGEAPGATEDEMSIPFCGESGKLLDNMLSCIGIYRTTNAYITNTVFWRPPANREPTIEEVNICKPFVEKHIALINPKLIILVGNTAVSSLLGKNSGITKVRQEYHIYSNQYLEKPITTTAIFHPAYLLRQPLQKKAMWYDLLKIQQFIKENIE